MANVERGFHNLAKIEQASPGSELSKVTFDLHLPEYVPTEEIGVHLRRVRRLMDLSGIEKLHITGNTGSLERYEPHVAGIVDSGVALAEGIVDKHSSKKSSGRRTPSSSNQPEYLAGRWVDVTLPLNISDISDRIGRKARKVRDPKAWAYELNQDIKEGIVEEGIGHVLYDLSDDDAFDRDFSLVIGSAIGSLATIDAGDLRTFVPNVLISSLLVGISANITNKIHHYRTGQDTKYRSSLFAGPQFDRALLLATFSRQRIIR